MWHRIFCRKPQEPRPDELTAVLHQAGYPVIPRFKGDDLGWTSGELELRGNGSPILLARYLTREDDLRDDLNAYAAELETMTYSANSLKLMEWVIQTQQLITLRKPVDSPDEVARDGLCELICRTIAYQADGVYQIDGRGWLASNGELLIQEY